MQKTSAGLLMFNNKDGLKVFLVHPGGPFYVKKDEGNWSIPKGEVDGDDLLETAIREFKEETGNDSQGEYLELGSIKTKSGKTIHAWAFEGELTKPFKSNNFEMEWPPKSSKMEQFPEVDRGEFFTIEEAKIKIHPGQLPFIERLVEKLQER